MNYVLIVNQKCICVNLNFTIFQKSIRNEVNLLNLTQKQKKRQMAFPLVFDAVFAITFFFIMIIFCNKSMDILNLQKNNINPD
jgi:hypothetical protein